MEFDARQFLECSLKCWIYSAVCQCDWHSESRKGDHGSLLYAACSFYWSPHNLMLCCLLRLYIAIGLCGGLQLEQPQFCRCSGIFIQAASSEWTLSDRHADFHLRVCHVLFCGGSNQLIVLAYNESASAHTWTVLVGRDGAAISNKCSAQYVQNWGQVITWIWYYVWLSFK